LAHAFSVIAALYEEQKVNSKIDAAGTGEADRLLVSARKAVF